MVLECPLLVSLDATFCSGLSDETLAAALSQKPPLESLVLALCMGITAEGLSAMLQLPSLRVLDLSYTHMEVCLRTFKASVSIRW